MGTLNTSDTISINTDTLQLTGGASYTGVLDPVSDAGAFAFDDITGTNLSTFGTRTLGLLSRGNIAFTGTIGLLGSGGLDMAASGSMSLINLDTVGNEGILSLAGNQINVMNTVDATIRPLEIASGATTIALTGNIGSGIFSLSGRNGPIITPATGIEVGRITLRSGTTSLTGGTISGRIAISPTGAILGSPGMVVTAAVAPVPLPTALPLFATGLGLLSLTLNRRSLA